MRSKEIKKSFLNRFQAVLKEQQKDTADRAARGNLDLPACRELVFQLRLVRSSGYSNITVQLIAMGFNINVFSENEAANAGCYQFIDRALYNFINTGEQYGDRIILLQSGQYYGLDLSPLLKLVYTNDEVPEEYVKANLQNTNMLLSLAISFRDRVKADPSVCDKVDHVRYEQTLRLSQTELDGLRKELGEEMIKPFIEMIEQQQKEREQNSDPWKSYFEGGQIINDLDDFIKAIQCYHSKGMTEIYLIVG